MIPGETIMTGAPKACICGKTFEFKVMQSAAGHYVGTSCCEGPNSRETVYFRSLQTAEEVLAIYKQTGNFGIYGR